MISCHGCRSSQERSSATGIARIVSCMTSARRSVISPSTITTSPSSHARRNTACGSTPSPAGRTRRPIDAQRCLGMNHTPMSEFWAWSWKHRVGDENRFFVKQPASAAHVNGRKLVAAEGFTTIGPHWQETLWDNLKPSFDHACTEGLNLLVWHAFVCSPEGNGHSRPTVFRRHPPESQRHVVVQIRRPSSPTSTAANGCSSRASSWRTPVIITATTCRTSPSSGPTIPPNDCRAAITTSSPRTPSSTGSTARTGCSSCRMA